MPLDAGELKQLAAECGFELAGITPAVPHADYSRFDNWRAHGHAGEMSYLTDHRGDLRTDPRHLLPQAQTILCLGRLYNTAAPPNDGDATRGWISRYAWGRDYHILLREALEKLVSRIRERYPEPFQSRICVDTAPLLERSYARQAGLGWIGRNTCLINQQFGSWFFLAEILLSIPLAPDSPPPDRCGTCRRCIDACPTHAIIPDHAGGWTLDARLCISYLTIEHRGAFDETAARQVGNHIFGCDICQDVCPWNRRAPVTADPEFAPHLPHLASLQQQRELAALARLDAGEFRQFFRDSPVWRAKYRGFLRNVAAALGNSRDPALLEPLSALCSHPDETISRTARSAYSSLQNSLQANALLTS